MDMISLQLPDGSVREVEHGTTVEEVARSISPRLAREAACGQFDGRLVDLDYSLEHHGDFAVIPLDSAEGMEVLRHTTAHIMAQAVMRLWPDAKLAIGPTVEQGFYYDFDLEHSFTAEDLAKIEEEMGRIVKEDLPIRRAEVTLAEAKEMFGEDKYKLELLEDIEGNPSVYRQGEFVDLCRGPHLPSTKRVKAFKLLNLAGAYWRGDSDREMLQRIYGTSFPKQNHLDAYLHQLEEAKKRDHNKLGRELELFTTSDLIGQGLPLLMPKGAKVVQLLQRFVEDEEEKRGYVHTKTPFMAKKDLYEISGHWQHYKDDMFVMGSEDLGDEVLALRPMTCPFQFQIYKAKIHSYRELPLRYGETATLFRNEASGEMHGLIRVRQFTISEGHLLCTPEQVEAEFGGVIDLIHFMMDTLGLSEDIWYRFSRRDPNKQGKYIDNPQAWEMTETMMEGILKNLGIEYQEAIGEAAFYGPKLDIQAKNVHGKEDTIITVQIDFALPERFDLTYVDRDGEAKRPFVIHRTSIGCYERTLAMLIEKYAGAFPTWLAPVQVKLLPIGDAHHAYAESVLHTLRQAGLRVELDLRKEKIGYKIREAQMQKVPYMLVIGAKEMENQEVSVRSRKDGDIGSFDVETFLAGVVKEVEAKAKSSLLSSLDE